MTPDGQALADDDATHTCKNCGNRVPADYVRVFAPDDLEEERTVRACPCGVVRKPSGGIRQSKTAGSGGTARGRNSGYDKRGEIDGSA